MKTSISTWSFTRGTLAERLRLTKEAGFDGFEIDLSDDGAVTMASDAAALKAVRAQAERAGLALSGLASGMYWGANPVSADPAVRAKAAGILERQLHAAHGLGIDAVLVVPGAVGADFIPGCEVVPYDLAHERATAFIKAALPLAERLGVTIGIENVWNKFLLSPLEMRAFIDSFGSQRVGAWFDCGNALATGYPQHWIDILGKRIVRVHVKDYRRAVGTVDGFVDLLSGDVDWPEVVAALKRVGYQGWISAEMIPPVPFYKHCGEVLIHNTHRAMQAILAL